MNLTAPSPTTDRNRRSGRARKWLARYRRTMAVSLVRGACYGLGAGAAGLAFWWLEQAL
ncbi:hypothetical protein [Streptomyces sp. TP-A0874]|uniref:hypothetical protein n=1 Tax=Streptomyces sp. TP-A0874 TaxID=549819 RepID=UPI00147B8FD7|nr:hypothetical protein [Streptomyces sp. TP-A0874]